VSQLVGLPAKVALAVPLFLLLMLVAIVVAALGLLLIGMVVFAKEDRRSRRLRQIIRDIGAAVADARRPGPASAGTRPRRDRPATRSPRSNQLGRGKAIRVEARPGSQGDRLDEQAAPGLLRDPVSQVDGDPAA
jgi:hypothetical protein